MDKPGKMNILLINTVDRYGSGASNVTWNLFSRLRGLGHTPLLLVRDRHSSDPDVLVLSHDRFRHPWARASIWLKNIILSVHAFITGEGSTDKYTPDKNARVGNRLSLGFQLHILRHVLMALFVVGQPLRYQKIVKGYEDYDFPGTKYLLSNIPQKPDIINCHNLHGGYFDLRELPNLSRTVPVVLTLHDAWLLGGHCAHSFDCERWKAGCGDCPDISIPERINRDNSAANLRIKKEIYSCSRLFVVTPSHWLMDKARQSILAPAIVQSRVIPNGVDLSVFKPRGKTIVRDELKLDGNSFIILVSTLWLNNNPWKDGKMIIDVMEKLASKKLDRKIEFVMFGGETLLGIPPSISSRDIGFINNPLDLAKYYQAADIYLHPARVDTFPTAVLESLACGTPVIATAVGGIPEQIDDGLTGFLIPTSDAELMSRRVQQLMQDEKLRGEMSGNASKIAKDRFDLNRQVGEYLNMFSNIVQPR